MQRVISSVLSDVMFLVAFGFAALLFILLFYVNPEGRKSDDDIQPPGNLVVEIIWPDGIHCDIDLWGKSPNDKTAVGYSRLRGKTLNLLRDDLGVRGDPLPLNYENMYSRGLPPGDYAFTVHNYNCPMIPVDVTFSIRMRIPKVAGLTAVGSGTVSITAKGQEITILRFTLDEKHRVLNRHTSYINLRAIHK